MSTVSYITQVLLQSLAAAAERGDTQWRSMGLTPDAIDQLRSLRPGELAKLADAAILDIRFDPNRVGRALADIANEKRTAQQVVEFLVRGASVAQIRLLFKMTSEQIAIHRAACGVPAASTRYTLDPYERKAIVASWRSIETDDPIERYILTHDEVCDSYPRITMRCVYETICEHDAKEG